MRIVPAVLTIFAALLLGLMANRTMHAQGNDCEKCCGLALSQAGYRYSTICAGNTCVWEQCDTGCDQAMCTGLNITCSGTYATYTDSCYTNKKCPCDVDILGECRQGCSLGY